MSDDTDWGELDWTEPQPVFRAPRTDLEALEEVADVIKPFQRPMNYNRGDRAPRRRGRPPKVKHDDACDA